METMEKERLIKKAILLSWFTIAYNVIEGLVSIYFGIEEESIALAGFGGDSFIEVFSAILVLWRFKGEATQSDPFLSLDKERFATRSIGYLFLALSLLTLSGSVLKLYQLEGPESTLAGLIISSLSLSFMFYLWQSKKRIAKLLDSSTVESDANCSLACIKLSGVLFIGSIIHIFLPQIWWADSVAALVLTYFIAKEGLEMIANAGKENFSGGCGCD